MFPQTEAEQDFSKGAGHLWQIVAAMMAVIGFLVFMMLTR